MSTIQAAVGLLLLAAGGLEILSNPATWHNTPVFLGLAAIFFILGGILTAVQGMAKKQKAAEEPYQK